MPVVFAPSLPVTMRCRALNACRAAITLVANRVHAPVAMIPLPRVETLQPERLAPNPYVSRPQIEIVVTHNTYVFVAVPNIAVRHEHHRLWRRWRSRGNDDRRRRHDDGRSHSHPPIRLNHTTCREHQSPGCDQQATPPNPYSFHFRNKLLLSSIAGLSAFLIPHCPVEAKDCSLHSDGCSWPTGDRPNARRRRAKTCAGRNQIPTSAAPITPAESPN